jgi:hypothetical protein
MEKVWRVVNSKSEILSPVDAAALKEVYSRHFNDQGLLRSLGNSGQFSNGISLRTGMDSREGRLIRSQLNRAIQGVPAENSGFDYMLKGRIKSNTPFVTRTAPGVGSNAGGAIEVVVPEGGVQLGPFMKIPRE